VDLVLTWRADAEGGAYEAWSARGMVRFRRNLDSDGAFALGSQEEERNAARAGGFDADDPARRFIAPAQQSYPFGYERIAQLFDSPNAPDLAVSPTDWAQGPYAGNHGALHVRQSRAPLWFAGPRVRPGRTPLAARSIDIAPTILAACEFPAIDGADHSGRTASERGVEPDVLLARQDGRPLDEVLDRDTLPARRAYFFLMDGLHMTELETRLAEEPERFPNLLRLREQAAVLAGGSIVNFPSITWPSHTAIGTGSWCGHHDVVNPSYYLREKRETVSPQGQQVKTEGFSSGRVESIYEAFRRVRGKDSLTAAIYAPFGRGADHAALEDRNLCERPKLKALTAELSPDCNPRWPEEGFKQVIDESTLDNRGMAQVIELFTHDERPPPDFVYHELILTDGVGHDYGPHSDALGDALEEGDRRIGRVLDLLEQCGLRDETFFVLSADHGMAPQDRDSQEKAIRKLRDDGLACVVAEPMVWLLDLRVEVERQADGRTGRVRVWENDALPSGERPEVEDAEVRVEWHREGREPELLAKGRTGPGGVYGFPTPPEAETGKIAVSVRAKGFNPRHFLLDGTSLALDLRRVLYGDSA
jgi:arylsulfatase A-like enzyme